MDFDTTLRLEHGKAQIHYPGVHNNRKDGPIPKVNSHFKIYQPRRRRRCRYCQKPLGAQNKNNVCRAHLQKYLKEIGVK